MSQYKRSLANMLRLNDNPASANALAGFLMTGILLNVKQVATTFSFKIADYRCTEWRIEVLTTQLPVLLLHYTKHCRGLFIVAELIS